MRHIYFHIYMKINGFAVHLRGGAGEATTVTLPHVELDLQSLDGGIKRPRLNLTK